MATPCLISKTFSSDVPSGATSFLLALPCRSRTPRRWKVESKCSRIPLKVGLSSHAWFVMKPTDTDAAAFHLPLSESKELNVVVLQPLRLPGLLQIGIAPLVVVDLVDDGSDLVVEAVAGIRRIADHDGEALLALDLVHRLRLVRERGNSPSS